MTDTPISTRRQLKPFGQRSEHALLMKEKALATMSRQECFDRGFLTVQDLDDEELRYGRCRDESGYIPNKKGGRTELIPLERYEEFVAEHDKRMQQKLRQRADEMIDVIVEIATDDTVEPKDRLDAAKYALERVVGKTPDTVNVNVTQAPWEQLLGEVTGIANISRREAKELDSGIIEAEWEDEDEDDRELRTTGQPNSHKNRMAGEVSEEAKQAYRLMAPPEPFTQQDAAVHGEGGYGDLEEDRFEPRGAVVANNTRPSEAMYMNEGDIPTDGHRKAQAKSYAEQARDAAELAVRRKAAKDARNDAKKKRKIARAMGADAIKDEITGATVGDDGKVRFE